MSEHPLAAVAAEEIRTVRQVAEKAGLVADSTRFVYVGLDEPPKADVLAHRPESPPQRRFRALLLDLATQISRDVVVDVTAAEVVSVTELDTATSGQLPVLDEEFELVEQLLATDERWLAALAARGLAVEHVRVAPLSAGVYADEYPEESGRRILRGLAFLQEHETDSAWAHPVDGLVAYVDTMNRTVDRVIDSGPVPVPRESGNYDDPAVRGPLRTTQKPIEITQPEGSSLRLDGKVLTWEKWSLRVNFDAREGLVLHQIGFDEGSGVRPVVYRASIAEMVVPYADPAPVRSWQNYFDTGEYLVGRYANALELGCDCLGEITYLDAVIADERGEPKTLPNAVCIHEEDYGILWKHSDLWSGSVQTRRQRRLVVSFFTTVGNYDYGFYWYFYLDGTIGFETKATGVVFTSAHDGGDYPYAAPIAPGLGAPLHQHLFSARLDMTVDGPRNQVEEVDVERVPIGPDNPRGNAFTTKKTVLRTENSAQRDADPARNRVWHIVNPERRNRLGRPVGYALVPEGLPTLLADPASSIARRAAFATRHLWVTRYDPAERYPAGDFVNQHAGGAGLPAYTAGNRSLEGEDIVVWHTFGLTHVPRPEDWPVMPVDYTGFTLRPVGFFDRNPTLDVPPSASAHCHHGAEHS
ncbi:primary-amine oxidase [Amycolatopsis bartoniae]|uniref:Amine oxidase n=1 Tax=Amycolatopsis bartoniae TaxID=941986 RepID=A0A8H9IWQ5_9PSEU|nr:primary-amine oxidase [Amycolatopsis bartoniae]MBB2938462.1 primary-amine oxidase [Amycolatopsis bartoniae]TVT10385.1 primary-amine oxidase [Amycolatopsis bartoniae]GHF70831.1 amine oxidase [Amycolatopsis bartoniae]